MTRENRHLRLRYRVRLSRAQKAERHLRALDEGGATQKIQEELDRPFPPAASSASEKTFERRCRDLECAIVRGAKVVSQSQRLVELPPNARQ